MLNKAAARVLLVDDDLYFSKVFGTQLQRILGYKVITAHDATTALAVATHQVPDIFLVDVIMPGMNGFDLCRQIKQHAELASIPVIFITSLDRTVDKVEGFDAGGVDYISKHSDFSEVSARIQTHITLHHQQIELERRYAEDRQYLSHLGQIRDQFLQAATQDMYTPLATMRLTMDMVRRLHMAPDSAQFEQITRFFDRIDSQIDQMQHLVTDILDLTQLETGKALKTKPQDISGFMETILEPYTFQAMRQGLSLSFHPLEETALVHMDIHQMRRALTNLVSNAFKFTPSGGHVTVYLSQTESHIIIAVADTGIGISPEDLPNLFDYFFQVRQEDGYTHGTGLGLPITKKIIEQHNGTLDVESRLHQGSIFRVRLPHSCQPLV